MHNKSPNEIPNVAHNRWWQTFEVIFVIPFLTAIVLEFIMPFSLPQGFFTPALVPLGIIFIISGLVLAIRARSELKQYQQPTDPGHATNRLVTTGVFAISRNPLYLGGVSIIMGIALSLNLAWILVLLLPSLVGCHYILIAPEERYLAHKFGREYETYAASVRRWI